MLTAADFGLARVQSAERKLRSSSMSGTSSNGIGAPNLTAAGGSPGYMAPEIVDAYMTGQVRSCLHCPHSTSEGCLSPSDSIIPCRQQHVMRLLMANIHHVPPLAPPDLFGAGNPPQGRRGHMVTRRHPLGAGILGAPIRKCIQTPRVVAGYCALSLLCWL